MDVRKIGRKEKNLRISVYKRTQFFYRHLNVHCQILVLYFEK